MSSTALERHLDEHAGRPATLAQVLERMRPEIARALPRHLSPDRMLRIALTTLRREPQLAQAPVESLLGSLMLAAQLGLEPGPQGHVYLIPRRIHGVPEIVFVIGYKGLIDLAYRSGLVKEIGAVCVWQGEKFVWREGTSPVIEHEPDPDSEGTEAGFRCAYAIAQLTTGGTPHIVIGRRHITRARQASAIGAGRGPWASDWESMVNKTAIRRLSAFLPMSPEMRSALALDEQPAPHMVAGQVLDLEEAAAAVEHREPDDERTTAGEIVVDAEVAQATEEPAGGQPAGEAAERPRPRRTRRTQEPPAEQSAGATGQVEDAAPGGRRAQPAEEATREQASTTPTADVDQVMQAAAHQANPAVPAPAADPTSTPEFRQSAAEFQSWVDEETAPKPEQMALVGPEAKLVAMRAALAAVGLADRNDLVTQIVEAGRARRFEAVDAELIVREWPQVEPTPHALLRLRDVLLSENGP